jgi:asparaginyl-tRNA synthetase
LSRNDPVPTKPVAAMSYGGRVRIARLHKSYEEFIGKTIRVAGWAKNARGQKEMCFVEINDGSCFSSLQVVVDKSSKDFDEISKTIVGASLQFTGTLIKSPAKGQQFELSINDNAEHGAKLIGNTDSTYPIQGRPTLEVGIIAILSVILIHLFFRL